MGALIRASCALLLLGLAACIGTSPEQQLADELGPDPGPYEEGPLHRAGFPCTRCHGDEWWQRGPTMELAGTIYAEQGGRRGAQNAVVEIEDASGHKFAARTNRVGTFFVVKGGKEPRQRGDGRFEIPWDLDFPLRVSVEKGGTRQGMRTHVYRERSCAGCHRLGPNASDNGKIFVSEAAP